MIIGDDEDSIPADAVDLIKKLLTPNPIRRLGYNGSHEIKNHKFFESKKFSVLNP